MPLNDPFFSIVIPLYNKETSVLKTLDTVLNQTFQNFEIIIVNDGSTDKSLKVIESIKDSRLQVFSIKNSGVSFARNFGICKSKGRLVALLDADDLWLPHHLDDIKRLFEANPNCGMYAKAYQVYFKNRTFHSTYNLIPNRAWSGKVPNFFESSYINCIAWTSAVAVPTEKLKKLNSFDESITLGAGEDTDLWIRIALNYDIAFDNKVSAIYNKDSDNRISNINTNIRSFIDLDKYEEYTSQFKGLKKFLDLNRFSIAIQYKLVGNRPKFKRIIERLDKQNLNFKQKLLLDSPSIILKVSKWIKISLMKLGINVSSFQ